MLANHEALALGARAPGDIDPGGLQPPGLSAHPWNGPESRGNLLALFVLRDLGTGGHHS